MHEIVFTPAALLEVLQQIDELSAFDISVVQHSSSIDLTIGNSTYFIPTRDAEPVEVSYDAVEQVTEVNDATYSELDSVDSDIIEGGIIKELAKSLLIGGMVRLTTKLLGGKPR